MLVAAGLGSAQDHALLSLLALNGLRVSEATGANIEALGLERGHRTLTILRNGGKTVIIPLAPRTARAIDLAVGERCEGPLFLGADGQRLDRHAAARIVDASPAKPGSPNESDPTHCDTRSSPPHSTPRPPPRRPRRGKPRRPENHHALRPSSRLTRSPRHLHRGDLHRRRRPLNSSHKRARALCVGERSRGRILRPRLRRLSGGLVQPSVSSSQSNIRCSTRDRPIGSQWRSAPSAAVNFTSDFGPGSAS